MTKQQRVDEFHAAGGYIDPHGELVALMDQSVETIIDALSEGGRPLCVEDLQTALGRAVDAFALSETWEAALADSDLSYGEDIEKLHQLWMRLVERQHAAWMQEHK